MYAEHNTGEKELYDLQNDPFELQSLHDAPRYASVEAQLATRLHKLQNCAGPTLPGLSGPSPASVTAPAAERALAV